METVDSVEKTKETEIGFIHGINCLCDPTDPIGNFVPCEKHRPDENPKCDIAGCDKPVRWNYQPAPGDTYYCDEHVRRGCSCMLELAPGIEEIWDEESGQILNPAEDYVGMKDEQGKLYPCCEYEDMERTEKMLRDDIDKFTQVLTKIQEELVFAQGTDSWFNVNNLQVEAHEAAGVLQPILDAFRQNVGYDKYLDEAIERGNKRVKDAAKKD